MRSPIPPKFFKDILGYWLFSFTLSLPKRQIGYFKNSSCALVGSLSKHFCASSSKPISRYAPHFVSVAHVFSVIFASSTISLSDSALRRLVIWSLFRSKISGLIPDLILLNQSHILSAKSSSLSSGFFCSSYAPIISRTKKLTFAQYSGEGGVCDMSACRHRL